MDNRYAAFPQLRNSNKESLINLVIGRGQQTTESNTKDTPEQRTKGTERDKGEATRAAWRRASCTQKCYKIDVFIDNCNCKILQSRAPLGSNRPWMQPSTGRSKQSSRERGGQRRKETDTQTDTKDTDRGTDKRN